MTVFKRCLNPEFTYNSAIINFVLAIALSKKHFLLVRYCGNTSNCLKGNVSLFFRDNIISNRLYYLRLLSK